MSDAKTDRRRFLKTAASAGALGAAELSLAAAPKHEPDSVALSDAGPMPHRPVPHRPLGHPAPHPALRNLIAGTQGLHHLATGVRPQGASGLG